MKKLVEVETVDKTVIFRNVVENQAGDGHIATDTIAAGSCHAACKKLKEMLDGEMERAAAPAPPVPAAPVLLDF